MMDFSKVSSAQQGSIGTIIGAEAKVTGRIETKGACRIDGALEGGISSEGEVCIAEKASVKGDVSGKNVIVAGEVTGDVSSVEAVEIKKGGKVAGNIAGNRLIVDEGASYKGRVTMGEARNNPEEESSDFSEKVKEIIGIQ
ncbi:MAG: polymer-forming cytoskeletal protein [Candidatus Margulisiibacteriota bacterium]